MSVVGPRPHHFEDCALFSTAVENYALRTIAKPGITGLAQVTEYRGDFEWNCIESRVEKDLGYIRNWTLLFDLSLIAKTVAVIVGKSIGIGWLMRQTPYPGDRVPLDTTAVVMAKFPEEEALEPGKRRAA